MPRHRAASATSGNVRRVRQTSSETGRGVVRSYHRAIIVRGVGAETHESIVPPRSNRSTWASRELSQGRYASPMTAVAPAQRTGLSRRDAARVNPQTVRQASIGSAMLCVCSSAIVDAA